MTYGAEKQLHRVDGCGNGTQSSLNVAGNTHTEISWIYMQQVAKPTVTQVRDHRVNSPQTPLIQLHSCLNLGAEIKCSFGEGTSAASMYLLL